jgi:hypothetical protein
VSLTALGSTYSHSDLCVGGGGVRWCKAGRIVELTSHRHLEPKLKSARNCHNATYTPVYRGSKNTNDNCTLRYEVGYSWR